MQQLSKQPAFELGQIVATPGALAALKKAGQQPGEPCTCRNTPNSGLEFRIVSPHDRMRLP
jgi:hypothetical protein